MLARAVRKGFAGLFLFAVALMLTVGLGAIVPRPFFVSATDQDDRASKGRRILVLSGPIHTDIALPADPDVLEALAFVSAEGLDLDYPGVFWIIVGWGGRSFYIETPTWSDLKPGPVFDALTWDDSVMHVRRAGQIAPTQQGVQAIDLNTHRFDSLLRAITSSFKRDQDGLLRAIPDASYDAHDLFFPANGGFNALLGCNTWTARMLRIAGVHTGFWTPLPLTLEWSLEFHNNELTAR